MDAVGPGDLRQCSSETLTATYDTAHYHNAECSIHIAHGVMVTMVLCLNCSRICILFSNSLS
jgi:hypothetical protein